MCSLPDRQGNLRSLIRAPQRSRVLIRASVPLVFATMAACGSATPSDVATNPPPDTAHAPGAGGASGIRTVLAPLGLNVRDAPSKDGNLVGSVPQDTVLTVVDSSTDANHAQWFKVQGPTAVGWINADPALTSPRRFLLLPTDTHEFSALYPDAWTFAEQGNVVTFSPQNAGSGGTQTITVTTAASDAALGAMGRPGYRVTTYDSAEVCGVTTTLRHYDRIAVAPAATAAPSPPATPPPNAVDAAPELAHMSELRIPVDPTHTLAVDYVYDTDAQVADFTDFVSSLSFPSPLCRAAAPTPSPGSPAPLPGIPATPSPM